ncbi:MAG TPA: hypothetical protein VMG38_04335 [Trebonia sp.]|nr:hypothetical protein [Trebonia sp.]
MQGNYIVLYPGEVDAARGRNESLDHLNIFDDDYHGGSRATCRASDTARCDGGYKPLDCATYPFFPVMSDHRDAATPEPGVDPASAARPHPVEWLVGRKCPLNPAYLGAHRERMQAIWQDLLRADARVGPWLRLVRLVGYQRHQPRDEPAGQFGR